MASCANAHCAICKHSAKNIDPEPRPPFESDFKEIITVSVGQDKEKFYVHKDIICKRSPFFAAKCSDDTGIESQSQEISLTYEHPMAFRAYLRWLYPTSKNLFEICEQLCDKARHFACRSLCGLWALADFLGDSACKNEVIDNLVREHATSKFHWVYLHFVCKNVLDHTREGSGLRRWLVDSLVPLTNSWNLAGVLEGIDPYMVRKILEAFIRMKEEGNYRVPQLSDASRYYE